MTLRGAEQIAGAMGISSLPSILEVLVRSDLQVQTRRISGVALIAYVVQTQRFRAIILLADDEVLIRNVARRVLQSAGYFVLPANDGEEALDISRQYPGKIHVLLSDVNMPNLDGLELREQILFERPGTKVLLMSGQIESPAESIPFLRKPFRSSVLKERIHQLLDSEQDQSL
jgi:CheY-like chemotaxis protein